MADDTEETTPDAPDVEAPTEDTPAAAAPTDDAPVADVPSTPDPAAQVIAEATTPTSSKKVDKDTPISNLPDTDEEPPSPPPTKDEIKISAPTQNQLDYHDRLVAEDLAKGHITPQTYQKLFDDKNVLGKIGSFFGLMLSGAGSGLAHQPNMMLDMMNKEIERDLEAQKASATNKQNFLNISRELGQAPAIRAKNKADGEYLASQTAANIMRTVVGANVLGIADVLPPGQTKDAATAMAGTVNQAVQQKNSDNNAQTDQRFRMTRIMRGEKPQYGDTTLGVDLKSLRGLAAAKIEGFDAGKATTEAEKVNNVDSIGNLYEEAFNHVQNMVGKGEKGGAAARSLLGKIPLVGGVASDIATRLEGERNAYLQTVAHQMAKAGGAQSEDAARQMMDSYFPNMVDDAASIAAKHKAGHAHLNQLRSATPTLDQWSLKADYPYSQYLDEKPKAKK